jgi:hypothetical protein
MANNTIDLKVTADYSDIQVMRRELVGVSKDAKASASVFDREFNKVERQLTASASSAQKYYTETYKLDRAHKSAAQSASVFEKEIEQQAQAFHRLKMSTDASYASTNKLQAAKKILKREVRENGMAVEQYVEAMRKVVQANNASSASAQLLGKRTSRFGVLAQQTGYQVGDFAVQVQSGQNVMVAFGQQATQLVGTFSMLAKTTKMITLFAGLGVAIPILTGIAAAFFRAREAADDSSLAVKAFEESLKAAKQETVAMTQKLEFLNSGFKTEDEFALYKDLARATAEVVRLQESLENLKSPDAYFESEANRSAAISLAQTAIGLAEKKRDVAEAALQTHIETLSELKAQEFARQENLRLQKEQEQAEKAYANLVAKTTESQAQRLEIAKRIHHSGKDSLLTAELIARKEGERLGFTEETLANYVAEELAIREIVLQTEKKVAAQKEQDDYFEKIAEALKDGKSLSELNLKSPFEKALPAAKLLAATMNIALTDALSLINAASSDDGPVVRGRGKSQGAGSTASGRFLLSIGGTQESPYKTKKKGGGGSKKSSAEGLREYLEGLKQQSDVEGKLVGLFGEKRDIQEAVLKAQQKYEKAFGPAQKKQLEAALLQNEAYKEQHRVLEEAKGQQEEVAGVIADSFGSAFMSIVEGTKSAKEAFKDMARSIVKQLFQILVVERMVKSIKGFIGGIGAVQADGGAWQGGSQIQAYANGGVVGGPTYFPMAGGKTGLMGEAGPEAIMPLKRGSNGKLGVQMEGSSQGNVVIHQSFNFQANGDDSVKKLIAQAAPQIANMTQKQIMDSRRRGGSMKAAFG